jgi:hypothetical protein
MPREFGDFVEGNEAGKEQKAPSRDRKRIFSRVSAKIVGP